MGIDDISHMTEMAFSDIKWYQEVMKENAPLKTAKPGYMLQPQCKMQQVMLALWSSSTLPNLKIPQTNLGNLRCQQDTNVTCRFAKNFFPYWSTLRGRSCQVHWGLGTAVTEGSVHHWGFGPPAAREGFTPTLRGPKYGPITDDSTTKIQMRVK